MGGRGAENPCWRRKSAGGRGGGPGECRTREGGREGERQGGAVSWQRGAPGEWNQVNRGSLSDPFQLWALKWLGLESNQVSSLLFGNSRAPANRTKRKPPTHLSPVSTYIFDRPSVLPNPRL